MSRPFAIGLVIALCICGILLYLLTGSEVVAPTTSGGEESRQAAAPDFGEASPATAGAGESAATDPSAAEEPPAPDTPPMLRGTVSGEGAGIEGAQVMLFSAKRVEDLMQRAEGEITSLVAGGLPDVAAILDYLRRELAAFRTSAILARTDAEGVFEVRDVREGGYFLLTVASNWLFRYGDVVALSPERTETIELPLERGAAIAGRVVDPAGGGRAGVRVIAEYAPASTTGVGPLVRRALAYVNGEFLKGPFETVSADDGTFEVSSLPPGTYNITAYTSSGIESTVLAVDTGTTGVVVLFGRPAAVVGTISTPGGFPLPEVPLRLERVDQVITIPFPGAADFIAMAERILGTPPRETTSDATGAFRFGDLGAGRYRMTVETPGLNPFQREFRVEWGEVHDLGELRIDPGSTIRGRVISSETGGAIEGARVTANMNPGRMGMMNGGAMFRDLMTGRLSAMTSADGTFEIAGLRAGAQYSVSAGAEGYAGDRVGSVASDGTMVELVLTPGDRVTGVVLDAATGEGLAGATVRAGTSRAETDASGAFVLDGVVGGSRQMGFMFGGMDAGISDESNVDRTVRIRARAPGRIESDVRIDLDREADGVVIELVSVVPIHGIVRDPTGAPRAGALVRLTPDIPDTGPFPIDTGLIFFGVTVTGEDGGYRFEKYFAPEAGDLVIIADFPGMTRGRSTPFRLEELDGSTPYDVQLRAAATITGVVTDGSVPVSGAVVRLREGSGGMSPQEQMFMNMIGLPKGGETVHTDSEGRFALETLEPGDYRINAELVGYTDSPEQDLTIAEGETIDLTLILDPGAVLTGTVADDLGVAVAGATVRVIEETGVEEEELQVQLFLGGALKSTRTDENGAYTIVGLASGGYTVVAEKRGYAKGVESGIYVHDTTTQHLSLLPSAALQGQVVDRATGRPISDFDVMVSRQDRDFEFGGGAEQVSSVDGIFAREDLDPGPYDVTIIAAGYGGAEFEVELQPGTVREERIELARAGRIEGVVVDARDGSPVEGARVKIERPAAAGEDPASMRSIIRDLTRAESDTTDSGGRFVLDSVPVGEHSIVVNHESYVVLRQPAPAVGSGQLAEVELRLSPGNTLSGTARRADGTVAVETYVILVGEDEANAAVRKGVATDESGRFTFEGLADGEYRLRSRYGGAGVAETTVTVDGNTSGVELLFGAGD